MESLTRRQFLKGLGGITCSVGGMILTSSYAFSSTGLHSAKYYTNIDEVTVQCDLCFRGCTISDRGRGFCQARENIDGDLYSLVYGKPVAIHNDPIEKEPMYHMLPGTNALSLGTATCNLRCKFCINYHISQKGPEEVEAIPTSPKEIVDLAIENDIPAICFTYNEPTQLYEYMYDIMELAHNEGLLTTFHSNGGMKEEPLRAILPYVDAVAVDLKGFTEDYYRKVTTGNLEPVLKSLKIIKEGGIWLEIINLIVPTLNDNPEEINQMTTWIKQELGEGTPLHFSRFFPSYKLTKLPPTPLHTLEKAHQIAKEVGLHYVYLGNVPGHQYSNTFCPNCERMLIRRKQFLIAENNIEERRCKFCGEEIPGIWSF